MSDLSLWQRILAALEGGVEVIRRMFEPHSATDSVAFSISFIALAAKLAKADGIVTRDEVAMFRRVFEIPPKEEANAARVYNLCRQETTGYEAYAQQLSRALERSEVGDQLRADVLDGLFHVAMADGEYHENENAFLERVAQIFGLPEATFIAMRARHVPELRDPWIVVGLPPTATLEELKAQRRAFVRENHPDRLIARGLPPEMIELANFRLSLFNDAYDTVEHLIAGRHHQSTD